AFLIWLPQWRTTRSANLSSSRALHERGIWRSPLAWQVTLFLGCVPAKSGNTSEQKIRNFVLQERSGLVFYQLNAFLVQQVITFN
ncbi:hypothetical protein MJN69_27480, partial [Salmonella enterica subsp. enterica serovar Kentucky]|nr:hypothetical protein [Salmonella enterica subsp. enterica serovar Kentucky]